MPIQGREYAYYRDIELLDDSIKSSIIPLNLSVDDGDYKGVQIFNKFGIREDVGTGEPPVDLWEVPGDYTGFPDVAEPLEIVSDSTNDTDGGSGARTVLITNLLDENYNVMPDVTVTLNGTSPVSLGTQSYLRCTRMLVLNGGTDAGNEGTLTLRHQTTTSNVFATITPGLNQTQIACYTVPNNHRLVINQATINLSRLNGQAGSGEVSIRSKNFGGVFRAVRYFTITNSQNFRFTNSSAIFEPRTDIKITIESISATSTVTGSFEGLLVNDELYKTLD